MLAAHQDLTHVQDAVRNARWGAGLGAWACDHEIILHPSAANFFVVPSDGPSIIFARIRLAAIMEVLPGHSWISMSGSCERSGTDKSQPRRDTELGPRSSPQV